MSELLDIEPPMAPGKKKKKGFFDRIHDSLSKPLFSHHHEDTQSEGSLGELRASLGIDKDKTVSVSEHLDQLEKSANEDVLDQLSQYEEEQSTPSAPEDLVQKDTTQVPDIPSVAQAPKEESTVDSPTPKSMGKPIIQEESKPAPVDPTQETTAPKSPTQEPSKPEEPTQPPATDIAQMPKEAQTDTIKQGSFDITDFTKDPDAHETQQSQSPFAAEDTREQKGPSADWIKDLEEENTSSKKNLSELAAESTTPSATSGSPWAAEEENTAVGDTSWANEDAKEVLAGDTKPATPTTEKPKVPTKSLVAEKELVAVDTTNQDSQETMLETVSQEDDISNITKQKREALQASIDFTTDTAPQEPKVVEQEEPQEEQKARSPDSQRFAIQEQALRAELKQLEEEKERLHKEVYDRKQELAAVDANIHKVDPHELQLLKQQQEMLTGKNHELEVKLKELQETINASQQKIQSLREQEEHLHTTISGIQNKTKAFQNESKMYEEQIMQKEAHLHEVQNREQSLIAKQQGLDYRVSQLQSTVTAMEDRLRTAKEELQGVKQQEEHALHTEHEAQHHVKSLESEKRKLQKQLSSTRSQLSSMGEEQKRILKERDVISAQLSEKEHSTIEQMYATQKQLEALELKQQELLALQGQIEEEGFDAYLNARLNQIRPGVQTSGMTLKEERFDPQLDSVIQECRSSITQNNLDRAKQLYMQARNAFMAGSYSQGQRDLLHNVIRELYDDISLKALHG